MEKEYINKVLKNRRAIFPPQYNELPIAKEIINKVLENANYAPTHKLTEPWRFKVLLGEAKTRLGTFLSDTYTDITKDEHFSPFKYKKIKSNCESAQVIIAICMQRDSKERIPEWEEIAATAMAVQNMWVTCTAHQVGCYWSSPKLIKYMDAFFELQEGERCLGFLYMGHYNEVEEVTAKRKPIAEKVTWLEE